LCQLRPIRSVWPLPHLLSSILPLLGHPTCMDLAHMADIIRGYDWKCIDCTTCEICRSDEEVCFVLGAFYTTDGWSHQDKMLFCDACDRGWHMYCMQPQLDESPPGKWFCPACTDMPAGHCAEPDPIPALEQPPDSDAPAREHSVASSSRAPPPLDARRTRSSRRKAKTAAVESDADADADADTDVDLTNTPVRRPHATPQSIRKSARKPRPPVERSPSPLQKRPRLKLTAPQPPLSSHKRVVLKVSAKGKEREESPDEEIPNDIFEDILDEKDRDTARTSITNADKLRFDKSRAIAEVCISTL
jgi:hypothetical protein